MVRTAAHRQPVGMDIVLVDDHPAVRAGLRGLVEDEDGLRVAATAATAREGFEAIVDTQPVVALVDLHLPDDDGLSLCLRTRSLPAPPRVIIYSAFADAGLAVRAVIAGAEGVLPKATAPRALLDALRNGADTPLDNRALRAVGERLDEGDLPILGMLAHGVDPREIAVTLGLEPEWLEARRWAMLSRLGGGARRHPLAAA
jgi:DNA-binding NarL/FixJ family response regulator